MNLIVFIPAMTAGVVGVAKFLNHLDRKKGIGKFCEAQFDNSLPKSTTEGES